jgi:hypothetical protein
LVVALSDCRRHFSRTFGRGPRGPQHVTDLRLATAEQRQSCPRHHPSRTPLKVSQHCSPRTAPDYAPGFQGDANERWRRAIVSARVDT